MPSIVGDGRDIACQIGLIAAGVERYIMKGSNKLEAKRETCDCIIDILCAPIGAVPVSGFMGGALAALLKQYWRKITKERKSALEALRLKVKRAFEERVYRPCLLSGRVSFSQEGILKQRAVDKTQFREWREHIESWCNESRVG